MIGHRQQQPSGDAGESPGLMPTLHAIHALYLHLPFCFHKCHYCDFYSVVEPEGQDAPRQQAFTTALIRELTQSASNYPLAPKTLFAGGGTPTFLRLELWKQLLASLQRMGILQQKYEQEFTVEANPETVTPELMSILAEGGVNRVSIGAQSFETSSLQVLERWHNPENVRKSVQRCRAAGINNFSLDLIFAIPGQSLDMLRRDLDALLELEPTHLSTYGLTYEPNTPLSAKLRVGQVRRIDEELERDMYELVIETLQTAGYEHYEVSNWAKKSDERDYRCQHNLAYWRNLNWLGVGPGAASHVAGHRWRNSPNLTRYLQAEANPPTEDHEELDARGRFAEQLMLGLRLREGIDAGWFDSHPCLRKDQAETAQEWVQRGLIERVDGRLRLTKRGLFVADSVIVKLL